jgi:hypothetical protein
MFRPGISESFKNFTSLAFIHDLFCLDEKRYFSRSSSAVVMQQNKNPPNPIQKSLLGISMYPPPASREGTRRRKRAAPPRDAESRCRASTIHHHRNIFASLSPVRPPPKGERIEAIYGCPRDPLRKKATSALINNSSNMKQQSH